MLKNQQAKDIKLQIELKEKEILGLTGIKRANAKREYRELLQSNKKECGLEDPIYLIRV